MLTHLIAAEFLAIADALATGAPAPEPALVLLKRYPQQTHRTRETPALVISATAERLFRNGRAGFIRVSLLVESATGDDGRADPDNHSSRVALVHRLFVTEKAARIAALNERGRVVVSDYGQTPGTLDNAADGTGNKLRSVLVLLVGARLV